MTQLIILSFLVVLYFFRLVEVQVLENFIFRMDFYVYTPCLIRVKHRLGIVDHFDVFLNKKVFF